MVGQTGAVLGTILDRVGSIGSAINSIASESAEQVEALAKVNANFSKIDMVTQQNAAMVEESNAAAHSLLTEAEKLQELVSRFQLSQSIRDTADSSESTIRRAA